MAVELVWRHPDRREVALALYVTMRMVHVPGWRHVVVAVEPDGHTWCGVELAADCREHDARDWSTLLHRRYRVGTTMGELVADPLRYRELYVDGGVAQILNEVEREQVRREELRRRAREGR